MTIKEFVIKVLSFKSNEKQEYFIENVSNDNASLIKEKTGLDITEYKRVVDNYAINHINEKHGNPNLETKRGQQAITPEDYENISEIVNNPDSIENLGASKQGGTLIRYIKKMLNHYTYVEEKRDGKRTLSTKTMFKK